MKPPKMTNTVFLPLGCALLILLSGYGCLDQSLDAVPVIEVEEFDRREPFTFEDSVPLLNGLLYRRLTENKYEDIYGLAEFVFPSLSPEEELDFGLFVISCRHGLEKVRLLTTVHRKYKSVLDIFAINPQEMALLQVFPDPNQQKALVADLVVIENAEPKIQQLTRLEISADGIIQQIN